ncbi:cell division cycle protein 123-like [Scleropages formosus]|uniref:Translation initiation factor eIF2 assembly protein n=1 Tax=Scleropages formosus TaxID=113540 RepID=A0A0P7UVM7_SCLFO|nr:cell division cycle protein 123-like [Scleropages formosus]
MKKEQVVNCQFSAWYPLFKKHTIKSVILALPQNVIDYLLDDGTLVVSGSHSPPSQTNNNDFDEDEEVQWSDDETTAIVTAPEFPEFNAKVQEAINALGGSVFPKLNWSAPRDANWIALNSSLKCRSLSDIFLLFKSSDFITHDLTQPFLQCSDDSPDPPISYELALVETGERLQLLHLCVRSPSVAPPSQLVLRKWSELIPGGEFRCFVKENKLIGISQRDYTQHYQHISKQQLDICHAIQEFFTNHIQYKFLDEDFVFDGRVWLIDLNPFGEVTNSLLFTWEELTSGQNLRTEQAEGALSQQDAYKLIDFLKLVRQLRLSVAPVHILPVRWAQD